MQNLFCNFPLDTGVEVDICASSHHRRYAVSVAERLVCSLFASSYLALSSVRLSIFAYGADEPLLTESMEWKERREGNDVFSITFEDVPLSVGLYYLLITCQVPEGFRYVVTGVDHRGYLSPDFPYEYTKPLLVYDRAYSPCEWMNGGVIYQIFVDRFHRGEDTPIPEYAVYNPDWAHGIPEFPEYPGAPLKNNMIFGGNLSGIEAKLDYLAKLGVSCLYLSPICRATSNHKYDTGNYMEVDPAFGGEEALCSLTKAAKAKGIRIILDGVFNHTGDDSLYFNRYGRYDSVGAYESKSSPYVDWYHFKKHPDEYECWWDIKILPKLNLSNPEVRDYFLASDGVIARYASMGIGGMRLDVADELDDAFIAKIKECLSSYSADNILYGEVWEDAAQKVAYSQLKHYYWGTELDGVMNYPVRTGLISYFKYGDTAPLRYALETVMRNAPLEVMHVQMNLLGTHDTERIVSALSDFNFEGMQNKDIAHVKLPEKMRKQSQKRVELAYLALATLPGVPCIYYGDEVGMEGYKDPFNRMPYTWKHKNQAFLRYMKSLLQFRRRTSLYSRGEFTLLRLDSDVLAFARTDGKTSYLTIINRTDRPLLFSSDGLCDVVFGEYTRAQKSFLLQPMSGIVVSAETGKNHYLYEPFTH